MNKFLKTLVCLFISLSILGLSSIAQAKRFGSGKNSGRQNTTAIQRANDPANAPRPNNPQQNQQQNMPNNQPQVPQKPRFGGFGAILGGVAAGLGLAWLASKLGVGAGFGNILLIIGVIMLGLLLFRLFKQKQAQSVSANASPLNNNNYEHNTATPNTLNSNLYQANTYDNNGGINNNAYTPDYNANNTNTYQNVPPNNYPIEINNLLSQANSWFTDIQHLSDNKDYHSLEQKLSPELFSVIKQDLQNSPMLSKTITQNLNYNLLDWRETQYEFLATLQYKAQVSEDNAPFMPINEAWTFTKDKTAGVTSLWKLDGISQLNQ